MEQVERGSTNDLNCLSVYNSIFYDYSGNNTHFFSDDGTYDEQIFKFHTCWIQNQEATDDPLFEFEEDIGLKGNDEDWKTDDDGLILKVSPVSPCKDAGNNQYYLNKFPFNEDGNFIPEHNIDIKGDTRIINNQIDIGAYETN